MKQLLAAAAAAVLCGVAAAQSVALQGTMGNRALLIIAGKAPRMLAPGEVHEGVKLLSILGEQAVVEIQGKRHVLRVGEAPASVGNPAAPSSGGKIVLSVDTGGHYMAQGAINGRPASFMVDTGATAVSMSAADAQRMGIDFRRGRSVAMNTANGVVPGWMVRLESVRVGEVEIFGVEAVVSPQPMPYVLLGNTFLNRFEMRRDSRQMVLERRY